MCGENQKFCRALPDGDRRRSDIACLSQADRKRQIRRSYLIIHIPKQSCKKKHTNPDVSSGFVCSTFGAEKRIRTSGRVTPVTRFPIVLLKPLRHLCKNVCYSTTILRKKQLILLIILYFFTWRPAFLFVSKGKNI